MTADTKDGSLLSVDEAETKNESFFYPTNCIGFAGRHQRYATSWHSKLFFVVVMMSFSKAKMRHEIQWSAV
jgi:hypothetical protein